MRSHSPQYEIISRTNQRENNEDSFQVYTIIPRSDLRPISILAVADGMGGHAHGEEASEQTLRKFSLSLFESLTIQSSINSLPQDAPEISLEKLAQCLHEGLQAANEHIGRIVKNNNWGTSGSTVVVAAILKNTALVINLGDSPLFHYQVKSKRVSQITEDHTVAGVLQRAGMITPEMARVHEGRSRLQFYVGCPELPPDLPVYKVHLEPDDLLLLCSDGINGSLLLKDIAKILGSKQSLKEKAEALVKKALDNKETDNQTLILWSHQNSSDPQLSKSIERPRSGVTTNSNNAPNIDLEGENKSQQEAKGGGFKKLFLFPLIFISVLAAGALAFSVLIPLPNKPQSESREPENIENDATESESDPIQEPNKTTQEPKKPDYYSCDEEPKKPETFSTENSYRLSIKYGEVVKINPTEKEEIFNKIQGILMNNCPAREIIDGSSEKRRFKEVGKDKMFEVWFTSRERLDTVEERMNKEKNQQGIEFETEIIEPEK